MDKQKHVVSDISSIGDHIFFVVGAASGAAIAHDVGAGERSRWAGENLRKLMPAFIALVRVAEAHPEEFAAQLGEPIELEPPP